MDIRIDKKEKTPVYLQIVWQIRAGIRCGELPENSALPSERALAQRLGVHRNTVIKAYGELKADGLISSKQGVGYVVCAHESAPVAAEPQPVHRGSRVNWLEQIRRSELFRERAFDDLFERAEGESRYSLGSGIAQPDVYDREKLARDISALLGSANHDRGFFSPYKGDRTLRQRFASFLSTKGVRASAGEIQVLTEMNQALSYIVSLLVKPGDVVMMEEPVSPDVYRMIALAGGEVCTVPVDEEGMDCDILERMIRQRRPRFLFVNSSFHDPTGAILPLERRRRIIELSDRYRIPIVEEDAASELVYDGPRIPPLKALDRQGNVIYIYSFSLTFIPGLSLAFVTADKNVIEGMSFLASVGMALPGWMTQKIAALYLEDGTYYAALDAFRRSYGKKQQLVCDMLDGMADWGVRYVRPRGGVYVWCRLPAGIDSKVLAARAYSKGLMIMPGYVFYPDSKEGRTHIRISYSYETPERLVAGMLLLRESISELMDQQLAHEK